MESSQRQENKQQMKRTDTKGRQIRKLDSGKSSDQPSENNVRNMTKFFDF